MTIVRQDKNHSYLCLKPQVLDKMKSDKKQPTDISYEKILRNLSSDSWHLRDAGSLDILQKQQNININLLMNNESGKQANHSWNGDSYGLGKLHSSWAMSDKNRGNVSVVGYAKWIGAVIEDIANKHPEGLDLIHMHQILSDAIGEEFNPKKFGSENLFKFLRTHYSKIVDVKKATHSPTGMLSVFVYPKNSRKGGLFDQNTDESFRKRNRNLIIDQSPFKLAESVDYSKQSPV